MNPHVVRLPGNQVELIMPAREWQSVSRSSLSANLFRSAYIGSYSGEEVALLLPDAAPRPRCEGR